MKSVNKNWDYSQDTLYSTYTFCFVLSDIRTGKSNRYISIIVFVLIKKKNKIMEKRNVILTYVDYHVLFLGHDKPRIDSK